MNLFVRFFCLFISNRKYCFFCIKDENNLESTDDEQLNELNKQLWNEEYYPVASRLYQRLVEGNEYFQNKSNK
jgi:hypothetical protein